MELFSQLGSIVSEPIQSWDSSKHHFVVLEFVPGLLVAKVEVFDFELEFEESILELHSR